MSGKKFPEAILVVLRYGINGGVLKMNTVLFRECGRWTGDPLQVIYAIVGIERPIIQVVCGTRETVTHHRSESANAIQSNGFFQQRV